MYLLHPCIYLPTFSFYCKQNNKKLDIVFVVIHHCHHLKQVFSFVFSFHFPPSLLLKHEFFRGFCFCLRSMWKKQQEAMVEEQWWRLNCEGWITHISPFVLHFLFFWQEGDIDSHCLLFYGYKTQRKWWWHHHHHFFLVLFLVFLFLFSF